VSKAEHHRLPANKTVGECEKHGCFLYTTICVMAASGNSALEKEVASDCYEASDRLGQDEQNVVDL
jgi:hypothetical protein